MGLIYTLAYEIIPHNIPSNEWYKLYKLRFVRLHTSCQQTKKNNFGFRMLLFRFPFSEFTPIGYIGITIFTLITVHNYGLLLTTNTGFFVGCCLYVNAFCEDLSKSFIIIDSFIQRKQSINYHLVKSVKFHIKIIEFV